MAEKLEILRLPEDTPEDAKLILEHFVKFFNRRWDSIEQGREELRELIKQSGELSDGKPANQGIAFAEGKYTGRLEEAGVLVEAITIAAELLGGEASSAILNDD